MKEGVNSCLQIVKKLCFANQSSLPFQTLIITSFWHLFRHRQKKNLDLAILDFKTKAKISLWTAPLSNSIKKKIQFQSTSVAYKVNHRETNNPLKRFLLFFAYNTLACIVLFPTRNVTYKALHTENGYHFSLKITLIKVEVQKQFKKINKTTLFINKSQKLSTGLSKVELPRYAH